MPLGKGFRLRSSWASVLRLRRTPKGLNTIRPEVIPQKENIVPLQNWWNLNAIDPISITGVGNIVSAEAFGLPTISLSVSPSSISSSETFGSPTISVEVSLTSIASGEAFGNPSLSADLSLLSINSSEAFGNPSLSADLSLLSIDSSEAFGTPDISTSLSGVGNIASAEAFGTPSFDLDISPIGIASEEAFGLPTITELSGLTISGVGNITSQEAFGLPTITNVSPPSPNSFRVGGGGNYDPYYWDKVRQKREEEELMVLV
jgi:hypothetical protein